MKFLKLLIDGADVDTNDYEYFPRADAVITDYEKISSQIRKLKTGSFSPADEEDIYAKYCVGNEELNRRAIDSAYAAFAGFQEMPVAKRFMMLTEIRKVLSARERELLELLVIEGHPYQLAEWEISGMKEGLAPETLSFYKKQLGHKVGVSGAEQLYWLRKPDGVVCLEPPKNASASNSFIAVLAFLPGNTLIVKPPLRMPVSTVFLWREIVYPVLMEYGAPPGVLNIILGNSKALLDQWLDSDKVSDVIYFGDSERGLRIGNDIYQKGKKPILELSGNDFLVVWKDADLKAAAVSLCDCFIGSSQICMVPKTALVHEDVFEAFLEIMKEQVKSIRAGLPSDPQTSLSPVSRMTDYRAYLEDALLKGGEVCFGGRRLNHFHKEDPKGFFVEPTLIKVKNLQQAREMKCVREETFFPLLPIVSVGASPAPKAKMRKDDNIFEGMMTVINENRYGLRFSLWIQSKKYLKEFMKRVNNTGLFRVNSRHVGFSKYLSTHGGPNRSGGPFGEMNYIWQKTSHLQGVSVTMKTQGAQK